MLSPAAAAARPKLEAWARMLASGVADVKRLKDEYTKSVVPLQTLATETERLERRVSDVVNAAFGLTPDEVKLMWDTAPPRMPLARPAG